MLGLAGATFRQDRSQLKAVENGCCGDRQVRENRGDSMGRDTICQCRTG